MAQIFSVSKSRQSIDLQGVDPETCAIVFKNHWAQVQRILEKHDPFKNSHARYGAISSDEASAVQNYVEHMILLLIEERVKDAAMGPILEFVVSENIMEKLFLWSLRREFTDETKFEQLRMYELLVTQSHQPLLHHKPILKPLMMLLSTCSSTTAPNVETKLVVLLNQLCSILAKDPSILELFFHTSEDQGAANFLIFSLLIPFIHREGTVGQQARDALLFIMSLSAENNMVAKHIVESTYFCPVLATGLSGLYSSLPTKLEDKGEEWHCLVKEDWLQVPSLIQFINSLEFCNAVIQVAHPLIRAQLVDYIYNGFLLPVLAPALHKVTVEEVMTTTAYLDLFLRSVSEPALLKNFLRFILIYQHENVQILDTLVSRINTPFRLCVVSLAMFRTLIGFHCEDVMLQLLLRYLLPCNHIMVSQRSAVKERDCYSAAKFLALTPNCCSNTTADGEDLEKNYIMLLKFKQKDSGEANVSSGSHEAESKFPEEYSETIDASYLKYLCEAEESILRCAEDCKVWSASYDGENPDPETSFQALLENSFRRGDFPTFRGGKRQYIGSFSSEIPSIGGKLQDDLEWDDSYDTGISPDSGTSSPQPPQDTVLPPEPPQHIQEMKKNATMYIKGTYNEEDDFDNDAMVYMLCAEKDSVETQVEKNESVSDKKPETDAHHKEQQCPAQEVSSTERNNKKNSSLSEKALKKQTTKRRKDPPKLKIVFSCEEDSDFSRKTMSPDSEDFIARCDEIINGLNTTAEDMPSSPAPESVSLPDEEDFEKYSLSTPSVESIPSPFGSKDVMGYSNYSSRTQAAPFTGPFISVVLSKLENMLENSLHVNLLLLEIITQLASYPQPLIRSFLLNTNMVFQPSIRSLYQVLASVKHKIEQFASVEKNFPKLLAEAQQYLVARVNMSQGSTDVLTKDNLPGTGDTEMSSTHPLHAGVQRNNLDPPLSTVSTRTRNALLAAAIFPEFLKELAALAQQHSVLYYVIGDCF
ncbi:FHF complex subunit HOOK-interacting protein 1A [Hyla sarda]|uniref:FHF complex subunit HOOK-interacting protein 1A n=1 Tax=Hyla sarda TaxID=327740 RepID=UPI0024C30C16|nr:FHF complex subunit HOOK-interacting protein 1A [Hyla sarda]XP_056418788.1 FHF complex subunit HOOK-interacting protein 1A [Hyla sarda]XP_056418789.1 FHF complex subunit HOOK-interacting protein 1A [Hyla sarda]